MTTMRVEITSISLTIKNEKTITIRETINTEITMIITEDKIIATDLRRIILKRKNFRIKSRKNSKNYSTRCSFF